MSLGMPSRELRTTALMLRTTALMLRNATPILLTTTLELLWNTWSHWNAILVLLSENYGLLGKDFGFFNKLKKTIMNDKEGFGNYYEEVFLEKYRLSRFSKFRKISLLLIELLIK